jgi:pSer/pThr/pTyr-binding forkhead associated (FHA) protein
MEVKLVVIKGSTKTREVCLRGAEIIVGRKTGCGLRIPSAMVSRRHCRLRIQGGTVTIEDLKSVNGSYLNGVRIYGAEQVRPGDQLEIGPVTFRVEYPRASAELPQAVPLPQTLPAAIPVSDDDLVKAIPLDDGAQKPTVVTPETAEDEEEVPLEFDENESWRLPEGRDLRDLLSSADES